MPGGPSSRGISRAVTVADTPIPLTEAQEGLWYAQRLDPTNPVFNTGQCLELRGTLDLETFRAAVNGAVAEADALALCIGEGPVQRVVEARRPWLEVVDVADAKAALAAMAADMAQPIDPARDRLAAQRLYRIGPDHHLWYQRIHHLAVDGFGTELLTRRVAALYAARLNGAEAGPPLAKLRAALDEDAAYRASAQRAKDAAYWQEALAGAQDVVGFAPGTALTAHRYLRHGIDIDAGLSSGLRDLAARHDLGWPDLLTALIAAYCRRMTGEAESILGVTFMGRLGRAAARVPAMVMNILPLRFAADEDAPLGGMLREVARQLAQARRHGRYRGEQIRRDLGRVGGGRRLHGALINVLPFHDLPSWPGLETRMHVLGTGPVDDITFEVRADAAAQRMHLEVDANPNLHTDEEVAAHATRLTHFLRAALTAERLSDIPAATAEEAHRTIHTLNATAHPVPDTTLVALIARQVPARPDATALVSGTRSVSYRELDERSAGLAAALASRGVGRGDLVAVALERSVDLLVALVAVLRAGAAYLPIDATHPAERITRILEDAKPRLLLADAALPGGVPLLPPATWPTQGTAPGAGPEPSDLAYVIYTSGSTGAPKGVAIEHRAIVNRLEWMRQHYGFTPHDRILQKTPITFDVSVWELFLPLITGATEVIAPPGAHREPAAIAAILREQHVTTLHFVPSMLGAFLADPASRGLCVTRVFCSGEELTAELRDRFHATMTAELHNLYGPTEAAVDVSYWPAAPDDRSNPVPIGWPVWNTRLYVLDNRLRPVPPGVAGHLFIAGVQLARGYLARPDLTERAFIPDPFHPGQTMYRTGDLARRRTDGAIVFLGRADDQVKIRGLRIELGEIEAALTASPMVRQARVIAREDRAGDRRLVAYLIAGEDYDVAALRAHVATRVPDYMVPSAFVTLPALPVNSSGKLDRAALPAPDYATAPGRPPMPGTETKLAALFAEVLGLESVGAEDDFFALGGHSLLGVDLMLRVRAAFGHDPGLGALFEHPTVARLAPILDTADAPIDHGLGPMIRLGHGDDTRPPLFLVHPAGGLAWGYGGLARALQPERSTFGIQAPSLDGTTPAPESMETLAALYAERVLAAGTPGPIHLAGWSVGGIIAHAMAVRLHEAGHLVGVVAMLDSYPADAWRREAEPDRATILRALLTIAGHDPAQHPELEMERDAVIAFLRAGGTPLGRLPDAALDGVVRVVEGNNALVRGHFHRRYAGTVTHFRAALDHKARPELTPALWTPYVGTLDVVEIATLHAAMTGPEAVAQIAPVLLRRLAAAEA